ncbi:MAG: hypothetical protein ABFC96_01140, partial [Thermoguttaceae bacterium]
DVGLEHLKAMTDLHGLNLGRSHVTDAGLKHLRGLTKLRSLNILETRVTHAGIEELRKTLPDCNIRAT